MNEKTSVTLEVQASGAIHVFRDGVLHNSWTVLAGLSTRRFKSFTEDERALATKCAVAYICHLAEQRGRVIDIGDGKTVREDSISHLLKKMFA